MDWTLVLVAAITASPAILATVVSWRNGRSIKSVEKRVEDVHTEVKTQNGKSIAVIIEGAEERRVEEEHNGVSSKA